MAARGHSPSSSNWTIDAAMSRNLRWRGSVIAAVLLVSGCARGDPSAPTNGALRKVAVAIASSNGPHRFAVELARTADEQKQGLMFRTDIAANGGMLFSPHPPEGGAPTEATFWMKNTPSPLDIIFIRADHTIARIAENTTPFSPAPVASGEPVAAVLEIRGGRAAELGIAEDDRVTWDAPPRP